MERTISENEMKEYRSRIAILGAELNDKNQVIDSINKEREELEELSIKAMSMGMQISD